MVVRSIGAGSGRGTVGRFSRVWVATVALIGLVGAGLTVPPSAPAAADTGQPVDLGASSPIQTAVSEPAPEATSQSWTPASHSVTQDGQTTLDLFAQPQFRRTAAGWEAIDDTITAAAAPYAFEAVGLATPVHFGTSASSLVTLDTVNGPLVLGLTGASVTTPTLIDQVVTYVDVFPGVDLEFRTEGGRLGKHLVLADEHAKSSFQFTITDPTHTLGEVSQGLDESWQFSAAVGFGTGMQLAAPAAWNKEAPESGFTGSAHQQVERTDDGYAISLSLDAEWARDADYPVVLDPAVEWTDQIWTDDNGLSVAFAPTGTGRCDGGPCTLADPVDGLIQLGDAWDDPDMGPYAAYVEANLAALSDRTLSSAMLRGYDYNNNDSSAFQVCADLNPGDTGSDLLSAICGSGTPSSLSWNDDWSDYHWQYDVTRLASKAARGKLVTGSVLSLALVPNRVVVDFDHGTGDPIYGWGSYSGAAPGLEIVYTGYPVPRPLTVQQTFGCDCWAGSSSSNQAMAADPVNTATGSLTEQFTDLSVAGVGQALTWQRSYNSLDSTSGPFGPGWATTWGATLTQDSTGVWVLRDGSGTQTRFGQLVGGGYAPLDAAVSATLADGSGGTRVLRGLDGSTYTFAGTGQLQAIRDALGQGVTAAYQDGRLTGLSDTLGQTLTIGWDSGSGEQARIVSVTAGDGRTVTYGYGQSAGAKRLASVTDVSGATTTYGYDAATGGLSSITDPLGHVSARNTYDSASGRITAQRDQTGALTTFSWDAATQTAVVTDPTGSTRTDVYDGLNLVKQIDATGTATNLLYDGDNNLSATQNSDEDLFREDYDDRDRLVRRVAPAPLNYTETWTYDEKDRVTSYTDPDGYVTTSSYDAAGRLASTTAADGGTTTYTYTDGTGGVPANLLAAVSDPLGQVTRYGYDASGNRVSTTTPSGRTTSYAYDAAHRLTSSTDPTGAVTRSTYDAAGRVLSSTDALGHVTSHDYDAAGRLTKTTDPSGRWTAYTYDAAGRQTKTTTSTGLVTTTAYDGAGRVTSTTDARGKVTTYTYDTAGRLASTTDPLGHVTANTYDELGHLTSSTDPTGASTTYTYDVLGRLVTSTDPDGVTTTTTYDRRGNVTGTLDSEGHGTTTVYDSMGRATWVSDADGTYANYSYDAAGQVTSVATAAANPVWGHWSGGRWVDTYDQDVTTYDYDADGLRTTVVDPLGNQPGANPAAYTTSTTYDAAGRPVTVTDPLGRTTSTGYDAAGQVTSVSDAAGNTTSTAYDALGRSTSVTDATGSVTAYTYDANSNLSQVSDPRGRTTKYTYDAAGNLTKKVNAANRATVMTYDAAGNLTSTVSPSGTATTSDTSDGTTTYTYDAADRLRQVSYSDGTPSLTYAYTAAGRLTDASRASDGISAAGIALTYDEQGRVTGVSRTGPTDSTAAYTYTPAGRLASTTLSSGLSTSYAYTAAGRLATLSTSGLSGASGVSYGYDAAGQVTAVTRTGTAATTNTTTGYGYDQAGQLTSSTQAVNGVTLTSTQITRDSVGNPTQVATTVPARTTPTAADRFTRARTGGWGTADAGGVWTSNQPTLLSVADGRGRMVVNPGSTVNAYLNSVSSDDVDLRATVRIDKAPTATGQYLRFIPRRTASGRYVADLRLYPSGVVQLRLISPEGTVLSYVSLSDLPTIPGTPLRVRVQAVGSSPTTLRAKVWVAGTDEPDWMVQVQDSSTGMQAPGSVGVENYVAASSTNGAVTIDTDDLSVSTTATSTQQVQENTFDPHGWLTSQCTRDTTGSCNSGVYDKTTYTYDAAGVRTGQTDTTPVGTGVLTTSTTYTYDSLDQLLKVKAGTTTTRSNTWSLDGAVTSTLTLAGTRTQATNLAGEVTSIGLEDGTVVGYSYDPTGNRTARTLDGQTDATWTWDSATGLATRTAQYDSDGDLDTAWLPDPTHPGTALAALQNQDQTSLVSWLLQDAFANMTAAVPLDASTSQQLSLDAFGTASDPTDDSTTVAGLGFAGQYLDQVTGLYDVRARDYDPSTGQFTTTDPATTPVGMATLSGFAYAANNPLTLIDTTGNWPSSIGDAWSNFRTNVHNDTAAAVNGLMSFGNAMAQNPGAAAVLVLGLLTIQQGVGSISAGAALVATGDGAPLGAPAIAVGVTEVVAGATTAAVSTSYLIHAASTNCRIQIMNQEAASSGSVDSHMIGANGTSTPSYEVGRGNGWRIDVENPAPGRRPGQMHLQDYSGGKWQWDFETSKFLEVPKGWLKQISANPKFQQAINFGLRFLGE